MNVNSDYYIHDILEKEVKPAFSCMQTSTDFTATKLFSRNREGMLQQDGTRAHTSEATIAWPDANIKHYIPPEDWPPNSPDLSPIENVWSIMATAHRLCQPRASVTASIKAPSPKSMKINNSINTSKVLSVRFLTDWKQPLKTVEIPFHTNSEHGHWTASSLDVMTLTFIGPLLWNFKGGLI